MLKTSSLVTFALHKIPKSQRIKAPIEKINILKMKKKHYYQTPLNTPLSQTFIKHLKQSQRKKSHSFTSKSTSQYVGHFSTRVCMYTYI